MTTEHVILIGAIAGALLTVGALLRGIWWLADRIGRIADAVNQLLPSEDNGHPSMLDRITHIERETETIKRQHAQHLKDHLETR